MAAQTKQQLNRWAWRRAQTIVRKQYPGLEKDDQARFDAIVGGVFKRVRKFKPQKMQPVIYFASGSNKAGEIQGFDERGDALGVAAPECGARCMAALLRTKQALVFVDSGAFSEVKFTAQGPVTVKPITDAEWKRRLAMYLKLARTLKGRLYAVAPDKIADQQETLRRLKRYRRQILDIKAAGANIIVPIQRGQLSMAEMYSAAGRILGTRDFVAGIPSKKDATPAHEMLRFVKEARPRRIHLLGMGPEANGWEARRAGLAKLGKATPQVFLDSVLIRRLVGYRGKYSGTKGASLRPDMDEAVALGTIRQYAKAMTAAQREAKVALEETRRGSTPLGIEADWGLKGLDYTDAIGDPSDWLTASEARRVAKDAGMNRADTQRFKADPTKFWGNCDFEQGGYAVLELEAALESAWNRYFHKVTTEERKRRGVRNYDKGRR